MSTPLCPKCGAPIDPDEMSVKEGVAVCKACGGITHLADLADESDLADSAADLDGADLDHPPPGCSMQGDQVRTVVRASARTPRVGVFLLFCALVWNGIISVFVLIAAASTLRHVLGAVPPWFPTPHSRHGGAFGPTMSVAGTVFMWLFLLPFLMVGFFLVVAALISLFGCVVARIGDDRADVFVGMGPLGLRQRFDPTRVSRVAVGKDPDTGKPEIVIKAEETVRIRASLSDSRRRWLAAALRDILVAGPVDAATRAARARP